MSKVSKEFSIMPASDLYETERNGELHRHEVFFGKNRQKSIKYGLVVFLKPEMHNMSSCGVHYNHDFDVTLKRIGQQAAMDCYGWTVERFIDEFGKNYL